MIVEEVLCGTSSALHHANDNELRQARVVHVGMDDTLDLNKSTLSYAFVLQVKSPAFSHAKYLVLKVDVSSI